MKIAYGYGRHSTSKQVVTAEVQEASVMDQYERLLKPKGYSWGGWFYDAAVSGSKDFSDRPEGVRVYMMAGEGDAVICHNSDRMFRSQADAEKTVLLLQSRGVQIVMPDLPSFEKADPRMLARIRFVIAQWEREKIGERTSSGMQRMSAKGKKFGGRIQSVPLGWRNTGGGIAPCPEERARIEEMARMHAEGASFERISMIVSYPPHNWRRPLARKGGGAWSKRYVRLAIKARSLGYPRCYLYDRQHRVAVCQAQPAACP
jgi:DNA invertase Pin-like site-specific DNA recombinase